MRKLLLFCLIVLPIASFAQNDELLPSKLYLQVEGQNPELYYLRDRLSVALSAYSNLVLLESFQLSNVSIPAQSKDFLLSNRLRGLITFQTTGDSFRVISRDTAGSSKSWAINSANQNLNPISEEIASQYPMHRPERIIVEQTEVREIGSFEYIRPSWEIGFGISYLKTPYYLRISDVEYQGADSFPQSHAVVNLLLDYRYGWGGFFLEADAELLPGPGNYVLAKIGMNIQLLKAILTLRPYLGFYHQYLVLYNDLDENIADADFNYPIIGFGAEFSVSRNYRFGFDLNFKLSGQQEYQTWDATHDFKNNLGIIQTISLIHKIRLSENWALKNDWCIHSPAETPNSLSDTVDYPNHARGISVLLKLTAIYQFDTGGAE